MKRLSHSLSILFLSSLLIAPIAFAGPKEDVSATTAEWAATLGEDNPDTILPLYAPDAVLWGTLSPTVRSDRAALRDYFVRAFAALPGLKVTFGEQLVQRLQELRLGVLGCVCAFSYTMISIAMRSMTMDTGSTPTRGVRPTTANMATRTGL